MASKRELLTESKRYLEDILGSEACSAHHEWGTPWDEVDHLPMYLQASYTYSKATLFQQPCLLMLARNPEEQTPAVIRKHWHSVRERFPGHVIYLVAGITSYNRKRLIEQRVPFLVPRKQLYLPMLGLDLREYFDPKPKREPAHLSYPAQALLLREILHRDCQGKAAKQLAEQLGYSVMTMSRAFKDLTQLGVANVDKVGREKHLSFSSSGALLWEASIGLLQNPVTKRIWVTQPNEQLELPYIKGYITGESALADYTDLAAPKNKHIAITPSAWTNLTQKGDLTILEQGPANSTSVLSQDRDVMTFEVWAYDPSILSIDQYYVDRLSLWLSLRNSVDERLEIALGTLLEQAWSTST